jgi:aspartyl protease
VIDLGHGKLTYEPEESALERLRKDASAPLHELDYSRCIHEGFFERNHRAVSATVNGVPAKMLIDTGASRTALARNNPALQSMLSREGNRGMTAAATSTGQNLLIDDVAIVFSETSFALPVIVHPVSSQCWQGAIGADLLRNCTLVWGYSSLHAACHAPARVE